jgi:DNA polymerase III epsilon subunit-like protein
MEGLLIAVGIGAVIWFLTAKIRPNRRSTLPDTNRSASRVAAPPSGSTIEKQIARIEPKISVRSPTVSKPAVFTGATKRFEFCALDTETTGIVPRSRRHRAFELSCVRFTPAENNKWSKTHFTRYVKVDVREMKGLKLSPMWESHASSGGQREAVTAAAALDELRDFVQDFPLVCHNAAFDKCVIENEIEKAAHRWQPRNKWICTLLMARSHQLGTFVGYSPGRDDGMSYRLEDVAKTLQMPFDARKLHFGYYDADVAGEAFVRMHHDRSVPIKVCP